jgi:hypothetical protein
MRLPRAQKLPGLGDQVQVVCVSLPTAQCLPAILVQVLQLKRKYWEQEKLTFEEGSGWRFPPRCPMLIYSMVR